MRTSATWDKWPRTVVWKILTWETATENKFFQKHLKDATVLRNITLQKYDLHTPNGLLTGQIVTKSDTGQKTKEIGAIAFAECNMLKHIDLGNEVTCIGNGAFWNCYSLESAELNINIKTVGENAFRGCEGLRRINCHCSFLLYAKWILFHTQHSAAPFSPFCQRTHWLQQNRGVSKFQNVIAEDMLFWHVKNLIWTFVHLYPQHPPLKNT